MNNKIRLNDMHTKFYLWHLSLIIFISFFLTAFVKADEYSDLRKIGFQKEKIDVSILDVIGERSSHKDELELKRINYGYLKKSHNFHTYVIVFLELCFLVISSNTNLLWNLGWSLHTKFNFWKLTRFFEYTW